VTGPHPAAAATAWTTLLVAAVSLAAWLLPEEPLLAHLSGDAGALRAGALWRLVTPVLVHAGFVHLLGSLLLLRDVGRRLESLVGGRRFLAVLALGTAAGSAAGAAWAEAPSLGATPGICALLGALLVVGLRRRAELGPRIGRALLVTSGEVAVLLLVMRLAVPAISWPAHLAGLGAGALLGLGLAPAGREPGAARA
jgi:membrane associated rhomboid family serine protease